MNCSINKKRNGKSGTFAVFTNWYTAMAASTIWAIEVLLKIQVTKISDAARLQYDWHVQLEKKISHFQ